MHKIIPALCIVYLTCVAVFYAFLHKEFISQSFTDKFETKVTIVGNVVDDPDRGLLRTTIIVQPRDTHEKILVKLPIDVDVSYGDTISFGGMLEKPESFITDTDRQFNYPAYLAVHNVYATMKVYRVEILKHHQGNIFIEKLFLIKRYFVRTITRIFPQPESGLFAGIIIGEKSLLSKDVLNDFQIAGLTHMIVLSGYNITIIAMATMTLFAWLGCGYRAKRLGAIITIPIFIIMTGMGASSVRAGVMAIIVFILQIATRPQHAFRIIIFALTVMVIANPRVLLYDPSLHLSFLAFIGLVYVAPITEKLFSRLWIGPPDGGGLRDLISETLAVQLFVLPYIIYMSGRISALSLLSNIFTVPIVPIIMGTGFIATLCGMVWYPIGIIISYPIKLGLSYIIWIAHIVASIEITTFTIPPMGAWWLVGIYLAIVGYLIWWHRKE